MNKKRNDDSRIFLKALAVLTLVTFISSDTLFFHSQSLATTGIATFFGGQDTRDLSTSAQIWKTRVPPEFGRVDEVHNVGNTEYSEKDHNTPHALRHTLIFIQDAHDSLEAQENIAKLIHHLVRNYGVKTVFEEGYEGKVPTDEFFGFIQDPALKEKTAAFFMDKLRVGGAEYAHINRTVSGVRSKANKNTVSRDALPLPSSADWQLIGADSLALHKKGIEDYRGSENNRQAIEKDLGAFEQELKSLIFTRLPKEFKKWLREKDRFVQGQISLVDYLARSVDYAKPETLASLPQIRKWMELLAAVHAHGKNPSEGAVRSAANEMDPLEMFREMEFLENEITGAWLKTDEEKEIFHFYQNVLLLKKLSGAQVSDAEFGMIESRLSGLTTRKIGEGIAKVSGKPLVLSKRWEARIENALDFYRTARLRDGAISETLDRYLFEKSEIQDSRSEIISNDRNPNSENSDFGFAADFDIQDSNLSVLVYGGFHKENIKRILKEKGINYIIVSPKISAPSPKHEAFYKRLMSVGYHEFEVPLSLRRGSRPQPLVAMGELGRAEVRAVYEAIAGGASAETIVLKMNRSEMRDSEEKIRAETHRAITERRFEQQLKTPVFAVLDDIDGNLSAQPPGFVPEEVVEEIFKDLLAGKVRGLVSGRGEEITERVRARGVNDFKEVVGRVIEKFKSLKDETPKKKISGLFCFPEQSGYVYWYEWDPERQEFLRKEEDLGLKYQLVRRGQYSRQYWQGLSREIMQDLEKQGEASLVGIVEDTKRYVLTLITNNTDQGGKRLSEEALLHRSADLAENVRQILKRHPKYSGLEVFGSSKAVDIAVRGLDKVLAIRYVMERSGFPENTIATFDDSAAVGGNGHSFTNKVHGYSTGNFDRASGLQVALPVIFGRDAGNKVRYQAYQRLWFLPAQTAKLLENLEKIADDPRNDTPLTRRHIQEVVRLIQAGEVRLLGEELDIVSEKNEVLGAVDRAVAHIFYGPGGEVRLNGKDDGSEGIQLRHRNGDAFVRTPEGDWILQQSFHRDGSRRVGRVFGGHVPAGVGYEEAIRKELVEELGFPKDYELLGKLERISEYGEISAARIAEPEKKTAYIYHATEEETQTIRKEAEALEDSLSAGEVAHIAALESQQKDAEGRSTGRGEIWRILFVREIGPSSLPEGIHSGKTLRHLLTYSQVRDQLISRAEVRQPLQRDQIIRIPKEHILRFMEVEKYVLNGQNYDLKARIKNWDKYHPEKGWYSFNDNDLLAPPSLYSFGNAEILNAPLTIALSGTTSPSSDGFRAAQAIAQIAAQRGWVVVGGHAFGVDQATQMGALDEEKPSLAVMVNGLTGPKDRPYPPMKYIDRGIIEYGGAMVSEFLDPATNEKERQDRILQRDRVMSALADVVLVIESDDIKSGTADTARRGYLQGKRVFAIDWTKVKSGYKFAEASNILSEHLFQEGIAERFPIATNEVFFTDFPKIIAQTFAQLETEIQNNSKRRSDVRAPEQTVSDEKYLDLVDEADVPTGERVLRKQAHKSPELRHRAAILWVFDRQGRVLVQKRGLKKDVFPGMIGPGVAGHVDAGEGYRTTVEREAPEEIRVTLDPSKIRLLGAEGRAGSDKKIHIFRSLAKDVNGTKQILEDIRARLVSEGVLPMNPNPRDVFFKYDILTDGTVKVSYYRVFGGAEEKLNAGYPRVAALLKEYFSEITELPVTYDLDNRSFFAYTLDAVEEVEVEKKIREIRAEAAKDPEAEVADLKFADLLELIADYKKNPSAYVDDFLMWFYLSEQLETLAADSSTGLKVAQIPQILRAVADGSLKLKGEDLDIIKVVDGKEVVIGAIDRNIAYRYGLMHRVPTTFILTPEGKFLIQRRAHNIVQPLMLALFGGHMKTGHTYMDTLKDEIVEELGLPEGWPVDETRIQVIRGEGAFKWAPTTGDTNNREMRSHYVYFANAEEIAKIRATGKLLQEKLAELREAGYKQWLESEQKAKNGLGEVWSIHEYTYGELMALPQDELSSDLLAPLLHDPANQDVRDTLKRAVVRSEMLAQTLPRLPIDDVTDAMLLYPKELMHSPELYEHLDAFDKEHYEFVPGKDGEPGYWQSKDFPGLILGTWEDIVRESIHSDVDMSRHIVTRFQKPSGSTVSCYSFDNHGRSVPYGMEAAARGEMPIADNIQLFVDEHADGSPKVDEEPIGVDPSKYPLIGSEKALKEWAKYGGWIDGWNRDLISSGFVSRHIWIDGDLQIRQALGLGKVKNVRGFKADGGWYWYPKVFEYETLGHYFQNDQRPKNRTLFINIDTDATGVERDDIFYRNIGRVPETKDFEIFKNLLVKLAREDKVLPSTFHASTSTHFDPTDGEKGLANDYGHIELVRFLARVAPAILLASEKDLPTDRLKTMVDQTIEQHLAAVRSEVRSGEGTTVYPRTFQILPAEDYDLYFTAAREGNRNYQMDFDSNHGLWHHEDSTVESLPPYSVDAPPVNHPAEKSWTELAGRIRSDFKGMSLISYHDMYNLDWFVAFEGETGMLLYGYDERDVFEKRTYGMFVRWNDGRVGSEDLRFVQKKGEAPGRVEVYRANDQELKKPLAGLIRFAIFGQRLIKDGKIVPPEDLAMQFSDIFHLYRYPEYRNKDDKDKAGNKAPKFGDPFVKFFRGNIKNPMRPQDRPRLWEALKNHGYMEIDYAQIEGELKKTYPELAGIPEAEFEARVEEKAFRGRGYAKVTERPAGELKEGEYFIKGATLYIRLRPFPYPHDLIGITEKGNAVAIVLPGNKKKDQGYAIPISEKVPQLQQVVIDEMAAHGEPIRDLFLLANSKDAFLWRDGAIVPELSSAENYPSGSAAIVFVKKNEVAARSEVRDFERFGDWEGLKAKAAGSRVSRLIDPAYILHDWMVLSVVNPGLKDFGLIYGAAGADLSNALLSTNMTRGLFVSDYWGWFQDGTHEKPLVERGQIQDLSTRKRWLASKWAERYRYHKASYGYSIGEDLRDPLVRLIALAEELDALGVENLRFTPGEQSFELGFEWQHPLGQSASPRTISFVDGDITRPYVYRSLLEAGFNGYYQRAGQEIPLDYARDPGFISELQEALPGEGYFITDDYAYYHIPGTPRELAFTDQGDSFPSGLPRLSIPHYEELAVTILKLRGEGTASDIPGHHYGWDVRIRKNEKDGLDRSEIREPSKFQKVEPEITEYDPAKVKVVLSVSGADEADPAKQWFDADGVSRLFRNRLDGSLSLDRDKKPYGSHDKRVEQFKWSIGRFAERYERSHPDEEVVLILPNGNLGINDWFIGVEEGNVYSSARDPKPGRVYDMLVTKEDGSLSVMRLQFMKPDGTRGVFDERGNPVAGIRYAVYGQRIVKNGQDNLKNLYEQFDDLRHIFRLPFFEVERDGVLRKIELGFSDGTGELYLDPELIHLALLGAPIGLSLHPLLDKGLTTDAIRQKYLEWEYKDFDARADRERTNLGNGEFRILPGGHEIEINLIPAYYPHSLIGLTKEERDASGKILKTRKILVGNTPDGDSKFKGLCLPDAIQKLISLGAQDVLLWANGKDLAGTKNSRGTGLEAILLTRKRSEVREGIFQDTHETGNGNNGYKDMTVKGLQKIFENDAAKKEKFIRWFLEQFPLGSEDPGVPGKDGKLLAEFLANSLEEDIERTEEFIADILTTLLRNKQLLGEQPRAEEKSSSIRPANVYLASGSPNRQKIMEQIFGGTPIQQAVVQGEFEPQVKNGNLLNRVAVIALLKTIRSFLFYLDHPLRNESAEVTVDRNKDYLWVGGDTLMFLDPEGKKPVGKPSNLDLNGSDKEKIVAMHDQVQGGILDTVSSSVFIQAGRGPVRLRIFSDKTEIALRDPQAMLGGKTEAGELERSYIKKYMPRFNEANHGSGRVADYWGAYRKINDEHKNQAGGFGIQEAEFFPLIDRVSGDPYVVMGFPVRLAGDYLREEFQGVTVPSKYDQWSETYQKRKIRSEAQAWSELYAKIPEGSQRLKFLKKTFSEIKGQSRLAAHRLLELRSVETDSPHRSSPSLYIDLLAFYLSRSQQEAEYVLERMVRLARVQNDGRAERQERDMDGKRIEFVTTSFLKPGMLKGFFEKSGEKDPEKRFEIKPNDKELPKEFFYFENSTRNSFLNATQPKAMMMVVSFEKLWKSLTATGGAEKAAKISMAAENRMFLSRSGKSGETDFLVPPKDDGEEDDRIKKVDNQEVEASSVIAVADQRTGRIRFGFDMALIKMRPGSDLLNEKERTLFRERIARRDKTLPPSEIEQKIIRKLALEQPVTVADVRDFFRGMGLKKAGGMVLQEPLFFAAVDSLYGDPFAAMAFPWQDTVNIFNQFDLLKSFPKDRRSQTAIFEELFRGQIKTSLREKVVYIPSRQLEDVKKKKDFYGLTRQKILEEGLNLSPVPAEAPVDLARLEEDPRFLQIDIWVRAMCVSIQMVEFLEAAKYAHRIHNQYFGKNMNFGGKVIKALRRSMITASPEEKKKLEQQIKYWEALRQALEYLATFFPLEKLEARKIPKTASIIELLGEKTEPFPSPLWDKNVARLAHQTELFRRLDDIANLWNEWTPGVMKTGDENEVSLEGVRTVYLQKAKSEEYQRHPTPEGLFEGDSRRVFYQQDQDASEKITRMHSALGRLAVDVLGDDEGEPRNVFAKRFAPPDLKNTKAVWRAYSDLLIEMVQSDFNEDFPLRPMTQLQESTLISDDREEWQKNMQAALDHDKSSGKAVSVAVYFNNAGMESWMNLWQVFLLLKLGFEVSIIVPEAPILNKDVTREDILFMLPYMDAFIDKVYGAAKPSRFLVNAFSKGNAEAGFGALKVQTVRIDARSDALLDPTDLKKRSFAERIATDLKQAAADPFNYSQVIRRNLAELVGRYNFNVLTGELWYGYLVGMGELNAAPLNAVAEINPRQSRDAKERDKNEKKKDFLGGGTDSTHSNYWAHASDVAVNKLKGIGSKGHVLSVHVHKNVRQPVDTWVDGGLHGRERGGLPDSEIIYGSFDVHYFYPFSWHVVRKDLYYKSGSGIEDLILNEKLFAETLKKFGDAGKFFFGTQEDRMLVKVYDVTEEVAAASKVKGTPDVREAYDFIYRTPTRGIRVRVIAYKTTNRMDIFRDKQRLEPVNGKIEIEFGVNFEHLLRVSGKEKDEEAGDPNDVVMTRIKTWAYLQSKVPALFRGHLRTAFKKHIRETKRQSSLTAEGFEVLDPDSQYKLKKSDVLKTHEIEIEDAYNAVQLQIPLVREKMPAGLLDLEELEKLYPQIKTENQSSETTVENPVLLRAQIIKYGSKDGMGKIYQYVPCWIEKNLQGEWVLNVTVPNLPARTEIVSFFAIFDDPREKEVYTVSGTNPRISIQRGEKTASFEETKAPSEIMKEEILRGRFWWQEVAAGKRLLPKVILAPVDERSQADERLAAHLALGQRDGLGKDDLAMIYSDLTRIGSIFDYQDDPAWWEYFDFITGLARLDLSEREALSVVQLAGPHDLTIGNDVFGVEQMSLKEKQKRILKAFQTAAFLAVKNGARALNINMGSPSLEMQYKEEDKISGGAALIENPEFAANIVKAVRQGAHNALDFKPEEKETQQVKEFQFPVSVKTRLGQTRGTEKDGKKIFEYDNQKTRKFLELLSGADGVSWFDIHMRTASQGYGGSTEERTKNRKRLKELVSDLQRAWKEKGKVFPRVFANGSINNLSDIDAVLDPQSPFYGVMIGRLVTNTKNPLLLKAVAEYIRFGKITPVDIPERAKTLSQFILNKQERLGDKFYWEDRIQPELKDLFYSLFHVDKIPSGNTFAAKQLTDPLRGYLTRADVPAKLEEYARRLVSSSGHQEALGIVKELERYFLSIQEKEEGRDERPGARSEVRQSDEFLEILKSEGFYSSHMPDSVLRKKIVNEFLDPPASSKADPELLSKLILPDYVSGTYANEEVKARPEWEWTHTYQIKFFEREMQKAIQQGLFRGDPALAQGRFARLWDAFMKFEDAPGHVYYGTLTNVQNNRVSVRLSRYVLFGRPDFDDEKKMKKVAERANALARDGLRESLFTETLAQLEAARDSKTQASLLYQALQMALYVAAPNIWFSDPEFQVDSAGTTAKIKELLPKALEIPLALDSTREFVREVLTPRPDGSDTKAIYFVDDNGDFIYHLYLIQSYLRMNPKLRVAVVAKSERVAIDTTVSDLWYELEQPEFSFLKQITGSRLQVIEQGPVYGGVNLRNASRELVRAILDSDVVIGLGQMLTETMNGIQRPAYHQADVDSKFHQRATGLPKGALYFARVPAGKKYINHYAEDNRIVTLKQTFDMERSRSEMRSGKPIRAVVFDLGNVFVKIHAENAARRLIEAGVKGMTAEQVRKVLYNSSFYKRFEVNELSAEEFHAAIAGALGIGAMSFEIFKQIWCEIFELVPETVALASRVKKAGYKVFFLSDTNLLHMDYLRKQYGFFDLADRVFSSYELKFRKEDGPEVFKVMGREIQAAYGIGMDEMLFLDDKAVNVKASEEAGLPGHIFNSASAAEDELSKRGVAFPPIRSEVSAMPASREVGSRDWKNSTVILDSPPKNRVASKTDRRELTPKDPAEIPLLKEIVVFSIEAGDLAALKNWPELLAIASFNPRKLFVAVTGKADAKAEARIKELSHFVTVFRDEQLSSLPKNAPVFHFGNMTENADAVRVRISAKLGRDLKALLGIASGSFFLPALLLDEQVRDSALSSRGGFLFDDGRFTGRYLEALFRSFEVISASA